VSILFLLLCFFPSSPISPFRVLHVPSAAADAHSVGDMSISRQYLGCDRNEAGCERRSWKLAYCHDWADHFGPSRVTLVHPFDHIPFSFLCPIHATFAAAFSAGIGLGCVRPLFYSCAIPQQADVIQITTLLSCSFLCLSARLLLNPDAALTVLITLL
jgi:hypothetical protein